MSDPASALQAAMAALEAQRAVLGSAVIDAALAPLRRERERLLALAAPEPPRQQLKQVSVLFVDVVGSTAIGQRLNPEDIHAVMDGALARFTAVVQAHHGRVLQYTGDGMLAAFGTETASEDDAEYAVRAGLGVVEAAREHGVGVQRDFGIADFNVRVGVHTGRVLLGAGVDAEGSIRGATVNIAARMEQTAPHGRLRISHDTWRLVRGLFETSELEAVRVKGVEQPLRSYLVERLRPHAFRNPTRGIEGVSVPMIGRDAELAALRQAFDTAASRQTLAAVTVVGEGGIGKSRLLAEFRAGLEEGDRPCRLLLARAHPRSALHPWGLVRDLFAWHLQIGDGEGAEAARDKFVRGLLPLFGEGGEAPVHALGHLIGLDFSASPHVQDLLADEARLRERAFAAATRALQRIAETGLATVVLVFDDLHWADAGSLGLARHLLQAGGALPLLCVFLTRPALFDREPAWAADDPRHRRIDVRPLDKADSRALADGLLQRIRDVPASLRDIVTGGAEGNPFYMEELVKMLIDDGVIAVDEQGWRVLPERLLTAKVPATLTGVLQARLDALPPPDRQALQQAAIVGHVFWDQTLAAVDAAALERLPELLRRRLVVPRDERPGVAGGEFVFQHQLLQQVTYDSILKAPRLQGHARAGAFWQVRAEVAGRHQVDPSRCRALTEAHDHCRHADPKAFTVWFDRQYSSYLGAYVGQTLRPLSESVLALAERHHGPDDPETARALTNLARCRLQQRDIDGAEAMLQRALQIQERQFGTDHLDTARTIAVLGGYHQAHGDLSAAEPCFRRALEIRQRLLGDEHPLTLNTLDNLAAAVTELGRTDEAEPLFRQVLSVRERQFGADAPETAQAMTALAEVLVKRGDVATAETLLQRSLSVQQRALGADHPDLALTLWHLAEALKAAGRHDEADVHARRMLEIAEAALGADHEWTGWGLATLAAICLAQGHAAEANGLAERAQVIFEHHFGGRHAQVGEMLVLRARAAVESGQRAQAIPWLERARSIAVERGEAGAAVAAAVEVLLSQERAGALVARPS